MANWKPGDRFRFVLGKHSPLATPKFADYAFLGTTGTVLKLTSARPGHLTVEADAKPYPFNDEWGGWHVCPSWLAPIDDDDSNETAEWDECVWRPAHSVSAGQ